MATSKLKDFDWFRIGFTKFVVYSLIVLFLILLGTTSNSVLNHYKDFNSVNIILITTYIMLTFAFIYAIYKKVNKKVILISIVISGFILRIVWALITKSVPVSDFATAYETAQNILKGDYSALMGLGYFARFPHVTTYVLFLSLMIRIFGDNALFAVKIINVILSTSSIVLVYLICSSVFKDYKRTLIGTFLIAILPSAVLYVPVYCSENIAMPFYLASIYLFILVMDKKINPLFLLLSGLLLSVGHLFRMVAYIVLIAYIMYVLIYSNEYILSKLKNILLLLVPFILFFVIFSNTLISLNITDVKLWNGSEPNITSAVRGSNIESGGSWNPEDAEFISERLEDREALEKACKERIIERYTTTPPLELFKFFVGKFASQWGYGDNSGAYWSELNIPDDEIIFDISGKGILSYQLVYAIFLIFIIRGLFNKKEYLNNNIINLFYIILCGYGVTFLILETQCRYAYIINFIFAILPVTAFKSSDYNKSSFMFRR